MKKYLCLALVLVLVLALFAGCTKSGGNTNAGDGGKIDTNATYPSNPPLDWPQYEASDVGQNILPFDNVVAVTKNLPLTGEKVTYTAWWPLGGFGATYWTNMGEAANMQELENRTNIHIEYSNPSSAELSAAFPLMIASEDYCDMIYSANLYTGGGDKAIEDGVYIRLNELIDQYAPNYTAIRNYTDDARKGTITSAGNIWGFYNICFEHMPGYMGLNIRKDLMDKVGITERPATIDDWDKTLGTMMDALGTEYAIAIPPTGVTRHSAFLSAWDIGSDWFQRDGKVGYGPVEPEFRNYVELMIDWYNKGYLRNDFYAVPPDSYNNDITWQEYGTPGKMVAADGSNVFGSMLANYGDENAFGVAVRQPILKAGDECHIRFDQGVINGDQLAITTACKNPELLVSWVDYRYTYEGYKLLYYGIEGLTYIEDQPHHIFITDHIVNNPDGASPFQYLGKYTASILQCSVSDYTNGWCFLDPAYAEEITVWGQDKCDHNYPNIDLLTAEDGSEFSALYSDIETYINETVPKLIMGSISMDKYDDFVNQIKTMGIDRCIELKQAALDDYNNR